MLNNSPNFVGALRAINRYRVKRDRLLSRTLFRGKASLLAGKSVAQNASRWLASKGLLHVQFKALSERVGSDNILGDESDTASHLVDWRKRHFGKGVCVVFPRSVDHVSKVMAYCNEKRVPVYPQGGNTSTCGGSVPDEQGVGIVMNLARMNHIIEVNAQDNPITVEAGCILAHVQ